MIPPVEEIKNTIIEIENHVKDRISQFKNLKKESITKFSFKPYIDIDPYEADIFSEASFCILTANSSASLGIKIQKRIGINGFHSYTFDEILDILRDEGHRFASQRAERIIKLRDKRTLIENSVKGKSGKEVRDILVKEIFGYGYKEASHFLRNVGFDDVAIIDRHIFRYLVERKLIKKRKTLTKNVYIECEKVLDDLCSTLGVTQGELDLYIFYIKTGNVLK
ncbi:N-glycosylase/DNA lyase [Persephonella sp.]